MAQTQKILKAPKTWALLVLLLLCPLRAFALGGTGVTSCNSSAPTPVAPESLTQFNTITGIGLNYTEVESTAGNNFSVALPAGAVVVQAYFWLVEDENTATPVTTATFNGTGVTATNATTNFLWSPLWYTTLRFDVTALVSATGTSYSWASGSVSSIGIAQSGFLVIVYQLASDTTETTLVFADGMNVWHANETTEDGPGPEPVGLNWNCADNPVCNPNDVSFSRAGGNIYNVDDGDVSDGKYADEIMNPSTQAVLWTGPSGQLPICGSEPCPQIASYTPGSPAFSVGQDATMYDLYNNTTYAAKDTVFLASLVLMNKCPNPQSPTPTPNWTATPSPTTVPTSCGPAPSLYSAGTEYAGGSSGSPFSAVTVNGPATLPTNPLLLVRIYMGDPSYVTAAGILTGVSLGGVPLAHWPAGINQIPTQQGTTADTDFETWYLTGATIPTGSKTLTLTWSGGASEYPITVDAEFFQNVDQSAPLGAASANAEQTGGGTYTSTLTTTKGNSLVSTLLEDGSTGGSEYAGCEATNNATTEFALASGAPDVSGAEKDGPVAAGGATTITWTLPTCNTYYWVGENVEIMGVPCNNSPTPSPTKTFTVTVSPTNSFTFSPTKTFTPSPTNTFTV
ncbi:MAG TPA: hypothetical protein VK914_07355, partial [bacterium]|nr:hypothetical protein [bacterium]